MNRIDRTEDFGIRIIPDIFICDKDGNILYYTLTVTEVKLTQTKDCLWSCQIKSAIGNLEDWFAIFYDKDIYAYYFRTVKRSKITGEDKPLVFAIKPEKVCNQEFELTTEQNLFEFTINFTFCIGDLYWLEDEDCPSWKASETGKYKQDFIKPKRGLYQIKVDRQKKRLKELKEKFND